MLVLLLWMRSAVEGRLRARIASNQILMRALQVGLYVCTVSSIHPIGVESQTNVTVPKVDHQAMGPW